MATKGFKETPFSGYHIGRDRLIAARVRGKGPEKQAGISYHWLLQPMVLVSDDGRSATGRFRLFQPRTGKTVGKAGDFFSAAVLGRHVSRSLCAGERLLEDLGTDAGRAVHHPRSVEGRRVGKVERSRRRAPLIPESQGKSRPDECGRHAGLDRQARRALLRRPRRDVAMAHDLPMWFSYTNPVSGRVPEFYQPDCVPCARCTRN